MGGIVFTAHLRFCHISDEQPYLIKAKKNISAPMTKPNAGHNMEWIAQFLPLLTRIISDIFCELTKHWKRVPGRPYFNWYATTDLIFMFLSLLQPGLYVHWKDTEHLSVSSVLANVTGWVNGFPRRILGSMPPERAEESCWPRQLVSPDNFILD